MHYRAFYKPKNGEYRQDFVDIENLNQLTAGAILVIKINDDGTRELISEKENPTPKEKEYIGFAKHQLEPKHDGGPTAEEVAKIKVSRQ